MEANAAGTEDCGAGLQRIALAVRLTVALNLDAALGQRFVLEMQSPAVRPGDVAALSGDVVLVHRQTGRRFPIRCWEDWLALVQSRSLY